MEWTEGAHAELLLSELLSAGGGFVVLAQKSSPGPGPPGFLPSGVSTFHPSCP